MSPRGHLRNLLQMLDFHSFHGWFGPQKWGSWKMEAFWGHFWTFGTARGAAEGSSAETFRLDGVGVQTWVAAVALGAGTSGPIHDLEGPMLQEMGPMRQSREDRRSGGVSRSHFRKNAARTSVFG